MRRIAIAGSAALFAAVFVFVAAVAGITLLALGHEHPGSSLIGLAVVTCWLPAFLRGREKR